MRRRKQLIIFALMSMLLLSGCNFNWFGNLTKEPIQQTTPPESGTVNNLQTYTLAGSGGTMTLAPLTANDKLIIGIAPIDRIADGVGRGYDLRVTVDGMIDPQATAHQGGNGDNVVATAANQSLIGTEVGGFDAVPSSLEKSGGKGLSDYRTLPGALGTLTPRVREEGVQILSDYVRDFWVDRGDGQFITVTAEQVASRTLSQGTVNLYLDRDVSGISNSRIDGVISEISSNIYKKVTGVFGQPYWLDSGQDIDILITPLGGSSADYTLAGYFDQRNYYSAAEGVDYTNECEMIYLNAQLLIDGDLNQAYGTIAHELQHLLFFSNKLRSYEANNGVGDRFKLNIYGYQLYDDAWINEGFAVLAGHLTHYLSLAEDLRVYSQEFGYFGHTTEDGLITWDNKLWDYGSAGLFAYYLYDHYGQGVIREVLETPNRVLDTLEDYVQSYGVRDFSTLIGHWMIANRVDRLSNNWDSLNQYQSLVLKTQPVAEPASVINNVSIDGNGVKYYEIMGPSNQLKLTVEETGRYSDPDKIQISVMKVAP